MTRSASSTYDDDFFAWTQEQAAALRRLRTPADVDIVHVAEEIEDLGKRDLREVASYLSRLFEHLIKIDNAPESQDRSHWQSETIHFQISALDAFSPSMHQLIDLSRAWRRGRKRAESGLLLTGTSAQAASECPFSLDELLSDDFNLKSALAKVTAARAAEGGS